MESLDGINWIKEANEFEETLDEILSFEEFMNLVETDPNNFCRPTCFYIADMITYYEKDKRHKKTLFNTHHPDSTAIFGQKRALREIKKNLINFSEEGFNNKMLLLVGPNGSSKSSIIKKIMTGLELYSREPEGKLYTFSWIFPIDSFIKGSVGLGGGVIKSDLPSYAYLDDKEISAILQSELKDHPILLIPQRYRQELMDQYFGEDHQFHDTLKKSYLYNGDISKKNRMIYDALLRSYKGDHKQVLKHIRVERFFISKRYSSGAVTIEPQLHLDARMQQITMDKRLASLPPSLQSLNLFQLNGEIVMANRGVLEFSDLLKRPLDSFKYLLMTMETKNINIQGILTELDIFFIGSSNEVHLAAFKQHPDYNSFKGRFNFIKVPYLLNYDDEMKIYDEQITALKDKCIFDPLCLDVLCLFACMTRIRPPQEKNYANKKLGKLLATLSPLEKILFITKGKIPDRFNVEESKELKSSRNLLIDEYQHENLYEGKFGISPRTIKQLIYEIAAENKLVTIIEITEFLEKFIERKNEHDFLNISPQGEYHNPRSFVTNLSTFAMDIFESHLRDCLGLVDERSYEDHIGRYIIQISALIKKEKIKNSVTGKYEDPDMYFIEQFEKNLKIKVKPNDFRSHLIGQLGAYYLDNPSGGIKYIEVFPNLVLKLQETFKEEQKKKIKAMSKNLVYYVKQLENQELESVALSEANRKEIENVLNLLQTKYLYSAQGSLNLLEQLIKTRY